MTIDYTWNYGFAFGFIIAEKQFTEVYNLDWAFTIMLGPISFLFEKVKSELEDDSY
jgi:lipoprotein signal peptidase